MTQMTRTLTIAAGFASIAMFGFLASNTGASASTSLDCRASSRDKVIDCCQKFTNIRKPLWMIQSGSDCGSAAVCKAKRGSSSLTFAGAPNGRKICWIRPQWTHDNNNPHNPNKDKQPGRK